MFLTPKKVELLVASECGVPHLLYSILQVRRNGGKCCVTKEAMDLYKNRAYPLPLTLHESLSLCIPVYVCVCCWCCLLFLLLLSRNHYCTPSTCNTRVSRVCRCTRAAKHTCYTCVWRGLGNILDNVFYTMYQRNLSEKILDIV